MVHSRFVILFLFATSSSAVQLINLQNNQKWVPVYEIIPGKQYWTLPLSKVQTAEIVFDPSSQRWELGVMVDLWSEHSLRIAQDLLTPWRCIAARNCRVSPLPAKSFRLFLRGLRRHPLQKSSVWAKSKGVLPSSKSFRFPLDALVLRRLRQWQARGLPLAAALDDVCVFVDSDVLDRVDLRTLAFHLDPSSVKRLLNSAGRKWDKLAAAAKGIAREEIAQIQEKEGRYASTEMAQRTAETIRRKLLKLANMFPHSFHVLDEKEDERESNKNSTTTPSLEGLLPELRIKVAVPWSLRFLKRKALNTNDAQGCERLDCL